MESPTTMQLTIYKTGFACGIAAFGATLAFLVAQVLQVAGVLVFPWDEILIFSFSQLIALPLLLEVLALHYTVSPERRIWSHAAVLFMVIYVIFVTANYAVQLAVVIPETIAGHAPAVKVLRQSPHSLFWVMDALGYMAWGIAAFVARLALPREGFQGKVRTALLLHSLTTPVIAFVYFYPEYSNTLLLLALPWAVTAPVMILLLAIMFRRKYINEQAGHRVLYKHLV